MRIYMLVLCHWKPGASTCPDCFWGLQPGMTLQTSTRGLDLRAACLPAAALAAAAAEAAAEALAVALAAAAAVLAAEGGLGPVSMV